MLSVNLSLVLIAAVAAFIIGFLFHGPLFGKLWMKLANIHPTGNEKLSEMIPQMLQNFLSNFICAYVLALFINISSSYYGGIQVAVMMWLGFLVTATSMEVIWMGKSKKLWLFEIVSSLVSFVAMGVILSM